MDIETASRVMGTYGQNPISREIDPSDQMWTTGPDWYWDVGRDGLNCLIKGLLNSPIPEPRSILDLACGYGRVGRHIAAAFPATRLIWCDVEGPEFCAKTFGGEVLRSEHELLNVEIPATDAIWVGSLFTHVPEDRARSWLRHITASLNPGGALVATFHGRVTSKLYRSAQLDMTPILDRIEPQCAANGWGFEPDGDDPQWGYSISDIAHLATIAAETPNTKIGSLIEGGWAANHDVLILVRD
jgi:SAM-dependent methyltransferase